MLTKEQLATMTPEETLVCIMEEAAEVIQAASKCYRFGWDIKYGASTNNELLIQEWKQLNDTVKAYFDKTRRQGL